jgi:transposase
MSMRETLFGDYPIPDDTRQVAQAAFPKGNLYLQLRDRFGMLYSNQRFAHLFAQGGKPALAPARLALVLCLQFIEDLSDEQAADAVRDRISWKYLLGLPLDDPGFDASVLCEFRARLLKDDATALLLDAVLELCRDAGLLKARSKQRTDSTYVLASIRDLSRLENVAETLRHALNQLAVHAPDWLRAHAEAAWVERYGRRITEYRLPEADAERQVLVETIGQDGYRLLEALYDPASPIELQNLPAVQTLRQVWVQQYYRCDHPSAPVVRWRTGDEQPPSARIISWPYDPEARYKTKRDTTWIGYAVHLTETCEDDTPNLITQVTTTSASVDDHTMLEPIQADLAARDILPGEHYVDSGYVDAQALVESQRQQIKLVGPMQADGCWQARTKGGITNAQFVIDWDAEQAVCPAGKLSRTWQPCTDGTNKAAILVRFAREDCQRCQRRNDCTRGQKQGRQLMLRPREQHLALLTARAWQETAEFKEHYSRRAGVEGTFTQAVRRADLRHTRYIGLAKTHLQNVLIAVALNLLRVLAWLDEVPRATTRISAFARLMAASP